MAENRIQPIIIVGAGIGGLTAAIALRQAGFEVAVYERAPTLGEVGAGLTLWANALRGLHRLGLAQVIKERGERLDRAAIKDWKGNTLVQTDTGEIEQRYGEPTVAIHRADLHRILCSALPAEVIHLNEECSGVEQDEEGVTAVFASGNRVRTDLLVGADGIHSIVRRQFFPQVSLRYAGYTAWRGITQGISLIDDQAMTGLSTETWGCGNRFGVVRLADDQVYWFATQNTPGGQTLTAEENWERLWRIFKNWHAPIPELLERTPAISILHNDILDIKPMPSWSKGRVTLLGDAAHATTPNMGQGACQAIESAVSLADSLKENEDLSKALGDYEAKRRKRTAWITRQSWQIGAIAQNDRPWFCWLRNQILRLTPAGLLEARFEKAIGK